MQKHAEHAESYADHAATTADHASAKQRASYQVTEHAPTHKGTKQRVPQKPNFLSKRCMSPRPIGPSGAKLNWEGETSNYATLHPEQLHGKTQALYTAPLHPTLGCRYGSNSPVTWQCCRRELVRLPHERSSRIHPKALVAPTGRIIRGSLQTCPVGVFEASLQWTENTVQGGAHLQRNSKEMAKHMCQACQWHLSKRNENQADKRGGTGMSTLCPTQSQPHKNAPQQQASNSNLP